MKNKVIRLTVLLVGIFLINGIISMQTMQKESFLQAVQKTREQNACRSIAALMASGLEPADAIAATNPPAAARLTFNNLREYKYGRVRGPIPATLQSLAGKDVEIAGYMIPLNEALDVTEFMLVQIPFFGCCYSIPPEPNETVMVTMAKGKKTEYVYTPIRVRGKFQIDESKIDGFTTSLYKIEATAIEAASPDDKDVVKHQGQPPPGFGK
jgi:hypothetical protein